MRSGRTMSMLAGLGISLGTELTITALSSMLLAKLVSLELLSWEKVGYGILGMLIITSGIGAKVVCMLTKRRKIVGCTMSGLLYWSALFLVATLFFGRQYSGLGVTAILIFAGSATILIRELKGEEKGRRRTYKRVKAKGK